MSGAPSLRDLLGPLFPPRVRERGARILQSGDVEVVARAPGTVWAEVELGRESHLLELGRAGGSRWRLGSTSDEHRAGEPCPYLWAALLTLDAPGAAPLGSSSARGRKLPAPSKPTVRALREGMHFAEHDPESCGGTASDRLWWRLDLGRSRVEKGLLLSPFVAPRLLEAIHGEPTPYHRPPSGERVAEDEGDDRIFRQLPGGDLAGWYDSGGPEPDGSYRLDRAQVDALLPKLCATERLLWVDGDDRALRPLEWDGERSWALGASLTRDTDRGIASLDGFLARGEERVPLSRPRLLLSAGYAVLDLSIARVDVRGIYAWAAERRRDGPVEAPVERIEDLAAHVQALDGDPVLDLPGLGEEREVVPVPLLRLDRPRGEAADALVGCQLSFDYDGTEVRLTDPDRLLRPVGELAVIRRDRDGERAALRRLFEGGMQRLTRLDLERDGELAAGGLSALLPALIEDGWRVEAEGRPVRRSGAARLAIESSGVDWLELRGGIEFDGAHASIAAVLRARRAGSPFVELGDGSVGLPPEAWLAQWGILDSFGEIGEEGVRFGVAQARLLDAWLAERGEVDVDETFARLRDRIAAFEGLEPLEEPEGFRGELRAYQREGLAWLTWLGELGLGGCLADDMGLGKTVQVLALLAARAGRGEGGAALVVAPRSVVFNWLDEAARFAPELRLLDYTGSGREALRQRFDEVDLIVTTYGTMRRDIDALKERAFSCVVLDEAQAIKNAASLTAKSARLLRSGRRLALSGTPVENHLGELWSLFEFLQPGMLGRLPAFQELVAGTGPHTLGDAGRELLASTVRPFLLRRSKSQVAIDLPERTEQVLHCELGAEESLEYARLRDGYRTALLEQADEVGLGRMKMNVLEALLRLRQAACHPGLIDADRAGESSAKLDALVPMLLELRESGHKALVFSQFTKLLAIVRRALDEAAIPYEYLDGRTRKREERVARFQEDGDLTAFLISLKAGGTGLNLTAADYVFLLDPWWNPAVEAQAIDRAHRIGQHRNVVAYRLVTKGTIEEKVLELQARKRELAAAVLGEDAALMRELTREDLEGLFSA